MVIGTIMCVVSLVVFVVLLWVYVLGVLFVMVL